MLKLKHRSCDVVTLSYIASGKKKQYGLTSIGVCFQLCGILLLLTYCHSLICGSLNLQTFKVKFTSTLFVLIFREALISRFLRFVKNRQIKDSLKLGYAKIKNAKFNTLL